MNESERGSIRVAPILRGHADGHLWSATFDGFEGTGVTKESAVAALRATAAAAGRTAPPHVYDVAGTIARWMN